MNRADECIFRAQMRQFSIAFQDHGWNLLNQQKRASICTDMVNNVMNRQKYCLCLILLRFAYLAICTTHAEYMCVCGFTIRFVANFHSDLMHFCPFLLLLVLLSAQFPYNKNWNPIIFVLCGFFVCQWKYSHWESFTLRTHGNRTTRTQRINALFYIENQTNSKEACSSKEMRMSIHIKIRKWNGIIILSVKVSME